MSPLKVARRRARRRSSRSYKKRSAMQKLNKTRAVRILRIIMPMVAVVSAIIFVPWNMVGLWLTPLPATVQAQLGDAVTRGLDGIIVYIDHGGEAPESYAAGWNNRAAQTPADPQSLFKIASISNSPVKPGSNSNSGSPFKQS